MSVTTIIAILLMLGGETADSMREETIMQILCSFLKVPVLICFIIMIVYFIKHPYVLKAKIRKKFFFADPRIAIISYVITFIISFFLNMISFEDDYELYEGFGYTPRFFAMLCLCIYTLILLFSGSTYCIDLTLKDLDDEDRKRKNKDKKRKQRKQSPDFDCSKAIEEHDKNFSKEWFGYSD